jgi:hypothetical protein
MRGYRSNGWSAATQEKQRKQTLPGWLCHITPAHPIGAGQGPRLTLNMIKQTQSPPNNDPGNSQSAQNPGLTTVIHSK